MDNKKVRQYVGILAAMIFYYIVHEGAHLIVALSMEVFKEIKFLGLGMQIAVSKTEMTNTQLGIFSIIGAICTIIASIILMILAPRIIKINNKLVRAIFYYVTLAMLFIDPLYLV